MRFIYPLGLLGLLGIPVLIIIYIIKNKYTEQIVPSTYLWNLSEKFLKKKKPISLISGIISLVLQILAVIIVSVLIAKPVITLPNTAKDYCFIIDGTGSMNFETNDTTRMEIGKIKIEELIESSKNGSSYTLIYVGATSRVVYENLSNKDKAIEMLSKLQPSGVTVGLTGIINHVQNYYNENKSLETYFVTDKDYTSSNINIINVSNNEQNYAIYDTFTFVEGTNMKVSSSIISYADDAILNVDVYVNSELLTTKEVECKKGIVQEFSTYVNVTDYETLEVKISNDDALDLDNNEVLYNIEKTHSYSTLIVSDRPFYLTSVIENVGNTDILVVSRDEYTSSMSGFSLYVFDSYTPNVLPTDGTVWLFGVSSSIDQSGFSVQDVIEDETGIAATYPKNSTSIYRTLTSGLLKNQIYVTKYYKYGLYKNFTVLLTHEGNPLIFTGLTDSGNREVVFAFDLHDSNVPLLLDYLTLSKNLLNYSFPVILEESSYICGDTVELNVLSNCDSIRIETPSNDVSYLDISSEVTSYQTSEVGTHTIKVMIGDQERVFNIFVGLPLAEQYSGEEVTTLELQGVKENNYRDGIYDELIVLFVILAVIYMADWMVYCYEQYQLR
jgi:hypothetical protein